MGAIRIGPALLALALLGCPVGDEGVADDDVAGDDADDADDDDTSDDDIGAPVDLSVLDAAAVVLGAEPGERVAGNVSGDLDGDGQADLVLPARPDGGAWRAAVLSGPFAGVRTTAEADATVTAGGAAAAWVSGVHDLDRDGTDDLLAGARTDFGPPVLCFGLRGPLSGDLTVDDADVVFSLDEPDLVLMDAWPLPAGDLDGDGAGDLAVAVWGFVGDASHVTSSVFLFHDALAPGTVDLASADARIRWDGSQEIAMRPVAVGDVDGDGIDDLATIRLEKFTEPLETRVFLGPLSGELSLADADVIRDGVVVAMVDPGDVGGDARDDLLIQEFTGGADGAGRLGVVFGAVPASPGDRADAWFTGAGAGDLLGIGASIGGDLDGDGRRDLLIGAPGADELAEDAGAAYLFPEVVAGDHGVDEAALRVLGDQPGEGAGWVVRAGPDLDGDGLDDLLVSAPYRDDGAVEEAGAVYAISGAQIAAALAR